MFAFMTGLGQGAVAGEQERRRRKREDAQDERIRIRDARETELYEREKKRRDEADQLETQMKSAGASVTPQDGTVYQPAVDDDGNAMPPNPTAGTSVAGGRRFATMGEAQAHATTQNTPVARMRRQADVLGGAGKVQDMVALQETATKIEKEGHLQFIDAQRAKLPTAEQIKAGQAEFALDPAAVQAFNAAGGDTIPPDAKGVAKVFKLPNGREVVDFAVIGADGKMLAPSALQIEQIYGMARADRERSADTQFSQGATIKHQEATLKESARGHDLSSQTQLRIAQMSAGNAAAGRSLEARRVKLLEDAQAVENKLPPAVKALFASQQQEAHAIDTALFKAQAEGTVDQKSVGYQDLMTRRRVLGKQMQDTLKPYLGQGAEASAKDPFDILTDKKAGAQPATVPAPTRVATMPPAGVPTQQQPQAPNLTPEQLLTLTQQAGQTLQRVSQARILAEQTMNSYGSRQRVSDQGGFNKAQLAYNLAVQQEKAARQAYQQLVQQSRAIDPAAAANVYAQP